MTPVQFQSTLILFAVNGLDESELDPLAYDELPSVLSADEMDAYFSPV